MLALIVDGKGGGIGANLIEKLKASKLDLEIIGVGTNSIATTNMNKLGIECATGENSIIYNAKRADFILGPVGILLANSMLGEISPNMANAISSSEAKKILVPINQSSLRISSVENKTINEYIDDVVEILKEELNKK